ncbi:hypothetical protein SSBR45G_65760 [Bradyrhizobium sp. SSBR45G]|nr:hypothetical protein SSBR45G_65760 [Bradyrhizobium sp. SSBR45G]GLH89089.1 hypothetical protein SSBR45R_65500 [Bradyrhizobium sp. SSBR45R]
MHCADNGGQQARRTREIAKQPFKPSRREGRVIPAAPVVPAACIFSRRRAMGVSRRPAFPAPSVLERAIDINNSDAERRESAMTCP